MKQKKQLNVPTSSRDIPLRTYQHLLTCDENLQKDPYYVLGLLCDVDVSVIKAMRDEDVLRVMQIAESALKFSGEEFRQKWKHKDTTYGFNPNMEEMTLGEITDLENYMNDPETYHKAMAVMYRPIKKETEHLGGLFQIEQYTGTGIRAGVMKELPLSYFFGVRTFFLTIGSELEMITRQFSTRSSTQKSKQSSD